MTRNQTDEEDEDDDDDDDDDAFEDDYFDVPGPNGFNDTEFVPGGGAGGRPGFPSRPGFPQPRPPRRRPPFFHCVMGGYGPNGPMPTVSHVIPSARRLPRYYYKSFYEHLSNLINMFRFVPSLPAEFPLGRDGIQGSMIGKNIIVCSPGASKLVRVQPVLRPVLRPIDQFTPFQA